jgi:hypothetical protein
MEASVLSLPKDLTEAYTKVLDRIEMGGKADKNLAFRTFLWILKARRRLKMSELCELVIVRKGDTELNRKFLPKPERVIKASESLVVYDDLNVRFSHESVNEYFTRHSERLPNCSELAICCLTYLSFKAFEVPFGNGGNLRSEYKALDYVQIYWGRHTQEAEEFPDVQNTAIKFLASRDRNAVRAYIFTYIRLTSSLASSNSESVLLCCTLSPRTDWQKCTAELPGSMTD